MKSNMKRYILFVLMAITQLYSVELQWQKDLATAFLRSAKEHKPLMVLVEKTGCGWCTKMKQETLADENISLRLQHFILVKVHKDDIDSSVLPHTSMVPTIYFLDHNKKILESAVGYWGVYDFNSWIDDAKAKLK